MAYYNMSGVIKGDYKWVAIRVRAFTQSSVKQRYKDFIAPTVGRYISTFYYPEIGSNSRLKSRYQKFPLPGVVFIRTILDYDFLYTWKFCEPCIHYYYKNPGNRDIAIISDVEINDLEKSLENSTHFYFLDDEIKVGSIVEVVKGAGTMITGIVDVIDERKGLCCIRSSVLVTPSKESETVFSRFWALMDNVVVRDE